MAGIPLLSVTTMQVDTLASDPPGIAITVQGHAGTPGWTDLQLVADADELSPDGILDLTLAGTPPPGVVTQVLTPVSASMLRTRDTGRVIAIRVASPRAPTVCSDSPISRGAPCASSGRATR